MNLYGCRLIVAVSAQEDRLRSNRKAIDQLQEHLVPCWSPISVVGEDRVQRASLSVQELEEQLNQAFEEARELRLHGRDIQKLEVRAALRDTGEGSVRESRNAVHAQLDELRTALGNGDDT